MKRKNILWGWAVIVLAMIFCWAFTSCGDDKNEEPQNPLFGAWEIDADAETIGQLEQMIVTTLAQQGQLSPDDIEILTRAKEIIASSQFVVQFNADGTARLYSYRNGVGLFITGTWTLTEQALILSVGTLKLPVTDLQTDGTTLQCKIGLLPLKFKKYGS